MMRPDSYYVLSHESGYRVAKVFNAMGARIASYNIPQGVEWVPPRGCVPQRVWKDRSRNEDMRNDLTRNEDLLRKMAIPPPPKKKGPLYKLDAAVERVCELAR